MNVLSTLSAGVLLCLIINCISLIACKLQTRDKLTAAYLIVGSFHQNIFPGIFKNQPDGVSRQVKTAYLPYCLGAESATPAISLESGQRAHRRSLQLLQMLLHFCIETKAATALFKVCVIGLFNAHASRLRMKAVSELIWGV